MPYPEHVLEKVCKALHQDDWDYIKDGEMWCPHCKRMRKG